MMSLGNTPISFVYHGNEVVYPNPIKDGLILWYDFAGMKNDSVNKDIAKDLSGMNNNGTLQNFIYTNESGYENGLKFDNIDDEISTDVFLGKSFTLNLTLEMDFSENVQFFTEFDMQAFYIRKNYNDLHCSVYTDVQVSGTSGKNALFYKMQQDNKNKVVVTMVVDDSNKTVSLYGNGEKLSTTDTQISVKEVSLRKLGRWRPGGDNFTGKILSTQAYNRALSDQEIIHNYEL